MSTKEMKSSFPWLPLSLLWGLCGNSLFAAGPGAEILPIIPAVSGKLTLGGDLNSPNSPAWSKAWTVKLECPTGQRPQRSKDATIAKALMDAENLYVGFICEESNPEGPWIAKSKGKAAAEVPETIAASDYVAVQLDPGRYGFYDYYLFLVDAASRVYQCAPWPGGTPALCDGRGGKTAPGVRLTAVAHIDRAKKVWSVELHVPLKDLLRHPQDGVPRVLGLNFRRVQFGADRGTYHPKSNWCQVMDIDQGAAETFAHMMTWKLLDLRGLTEDFRPYVQFVAPDSFGHVRLELGTLENELLAGQGNKLKDLNLANNRFKVLDSPRMERRDDLRPEKYPSFEPQVVLTAAPSRGPAAFASKPRVTASGAGAQITFQVAAPTDVAVFIVNAHGKVVRHLGAGVLGSNPPTPFQANSLVQELLWDFKDDDGKMAPAGNYQARVALQLQTSFVRAIEFAQRKPDLPKWPKTLDVENLPHPRIGNLDREDHSHGGGNLLQLDTARNELYLPGPKRGQIRDATTGQFLRDQIWKQRFASDTLVASGEVAFGREGSIFLAGWNELWRFDSAGNPTPFAATGRIYLPNFFLCHANPHRGICTGGPEGDIYHLFGYGPHSNLNAQVAQVAVDGRIRKYGLIEMPTTAAGIQVDRAGNIYIGCTVRPADHVLPEGLATLPAEVRKTYRWFYGSILKFGPQGGGVITGAEGRSRFLASRCGQTDLVPVDVQGAFWIHPGYAPIVNRAGHHTGGPPCACHSPRFGLDKSGRLFMPDGIQGRIEIMDGNANTIGLVGKRGANIERLEFHWPEMVVASDEYCYIADYVHSKIAQLKLDYAVSEELPVNGPAGALPSQQQ